MSKLAFMAVLVALLNFTFTFVGQAHAHPGCQGASWSVLGEECDKDGECDGEECDKDKDCEDKEET